VNFYLHYGCRNKQVSAAKSIDTTHWHNYAVDWQPEEITGYIDGIEWFRSTNVAHQPPGSMHQTIQLDWFPDGTTLKKSWMEIDWVRVYDRYSPAR
jgi:beta-glucanase (GH16 family)